MPSIYKNMPTDVQKAFAQAAARNAMRKLMAALTKVK